MGSGEDLYRRPGHAFVAEFLGRVNRLQAADAVGIDLGGQPLRCPLGNGSVSHWLVRPEDVEVQAGDPGPGWGRATVLRRSFLGDRVALHLQVPGQPAALVADQGRDSTVTAGMQVAIRIDPARLMPAAVES